MASRGDMRVSWFDRLMIGIAPEWGMRRLQARAAAVDLARHYEAAQGSRRTQHWYRTITDANAANGPALAALRELARDLRRNNGWARRGVSTIVNNTVGWGIVPRPEHRSARRGDSALQTWESWASSTSCDYAGRLNFYGLQRLAMSTIVESGEVLIVRQPASTKDGLAIPMRLQVLEPDYIDTTRNGITGMDGGPIIDGIEFDTAGRRVAYWLYQAHPGAARVPTAKFSSVRTPADRVLHVYDVERPQQIRGVSWLASAIVKLNELEDFDGAEMMQAKVAACFAAFVTDIDGAASTIGAPSTSDQGEQISELQPGHIEYLPPGRTVAFATPPRAQDGSFSTRALRKIAVSLGVTYEDLTGDYSQVNYSSARMARLAHTAHVTAWRDHMLIPQLCQPVWSWAMELVGALEGWPTVPTSEWVAPPMAMLEPDKEGLAYQRNVRNGLMSWADAVRERGQDPMSQANEIARWNDELDERGIVLDCDPRKTNASGAMQGSTAAGGVSQPAAGDGADPTAEDGAAGDPEAEDNEADDSQDAAGA